MGVLLLAISPKPGTGPAASAEASYSSSSLSTLYTITNMANAMLEETFKSSHPDLMACDAGEHDYHLALTSSGPNGSGSSNGGLSAGTTSSAATAPPPHRTGALVSSLSTSSILRGPLQSICKSSFLSSSRLQLEASANSNSGMIPLKDVSPSRKKSVDFALEHRQHHHAAAAAAATTSTSTSGPPPPKRARHSSEPWSPKQVVDGA
jgi:hypothetical protein